MVSITPGSSNIPGGEIPPSWCTEIVESHEVAAPENGKYKYYIENTFEGKCSTPARVGLWMVVLGFGFLPLLIPNVRRGALQGKWQVTTASVGTNNSEELKKVLAITKNDTHAKAHLLKEQLDKEKELTPEQLEDYISRYATLVCSPSSRIIGYYPGLSSSVLFSGHSFSAVQVMVSISDSLTMHTIKHARQHQLKKGSSSEQRFIRTAVPEILKEHILWLKKENPDDAVEFAKKVCFRFTKSHPGGGYGGGEREHKDFDDWLLQNEIITSRDTVSQVGIWP